MNLVDIRKIIRLKRSKMKMMNFIKCLVKSYCESYYQLHKPLIDLGINPNL